LGTQMYRMIKPTHQVALLTTARAIKNVACLFF
jgi:hypothetical protein